MTNPLDLFAEFDALNGGGTPTGGTWYLTSTASGSPSMLVCLSCDGGSSWNFVSLVAGAPGVGTPICSVGYHTPLIDINGDVGSCGPISYPDGAYVFTYKPPDNAPCVSLTATLTANLYTLSVDVTRTTEACMYELWAKNPITGTDTIPTIQMPSGWITPNAPFQAQVQRRSLLNCGSTTIVLDESKDFGISQLEYASGSSIRGPKLQYTMSTSATAFDFQGGGYIDTVRIANVGDVDLSAIKWNAPNSIYVWASQVKSALISALDASVGPFMYDVNVLAVPGRGLKIVMTCANVSGWAGFDKGDLLMSYCSDGDCPPTPLDTDTIFSEKVVGDFTFTHNSYQNPCGGYMASLFEACPSVAELPIYDQPACNYDTLSLINASGRRYWVHDYGSSSEGGRRQSICETNSFEIEATGCPGPIGPPTYGWSSGSPDNPQELLPLVEDTAEAECGDCLGTEEVCYPEARFTGHDGSLEFITCSAASPISHVISVASDVEKCGGGTITMSQLSVSDVPAAFTSSVGDPATQRITNSIPADVLPRTYYVAYRFREAGGEWSNFALARTDVRKGDCCV